MLDRVTSQQANLRAVKQLQSKFLCCLNCYLRVVWTRTISATIVKMRIAGTRITRAQKIVKSDNCGN